MTHAEKRAEQEDMDIVNSLADAYYGDDLTTFADCIKQALFIGRQQEQQWISVEDELPNEYDTVLIWDDYCVYSAIYFNGGFEDEHRNPYNKVTHWQPRPSPPKTK